MRQLLIDCRETLWNPHSWMDEFPHRQHAPHFQVEHVAIDLNAIDQHVGIHDLAA